LSFIGCIKHGGVVAALQVYVELMNVEFHTSPLDVAFVHERKKKEGRKYIYRMSILI